MSGNNQDVNENKRSVAEVHSELNGLKAQLDGKNLGIGQVYPQQKAASLVRELDRAIRREGVEDGSVLRSVNATLKNLRDHYYFSNPNVAMERSLETSLTRAIDNVGALLASHDPVEAPEANRKGTVNARG